MNRRGLAVLVAAFSVLFASPAVASPLVGDDNGDGVVVEDESGWDCATMGNLICGSEAGR